MKDMIGYREWAGYTQTRFTRHALERLRETGMTVLEAKRNLYNSIREFPLKTINKYKKFSNDGFTYWRDGSIIYTVKRVKDKMSFRPLLLVITVTDQKVTLKHLWQK